MKLHKPLRWLALGLTALATPACLELDQKLVLNPDGSGKVVISSAVAMPAGLGDLGGLGGDKKDGKGMAREMVVGMLRAEGIEAWSDVSYGVGKDGKTKATVTGYFPDVTKVKMANPMESDKPKEDLGVTKNSDGNWVIEEDFNDASGKKDKPEDKEAAEAAKKMTDEEVEEKLTAERQQWAGMKGIMAGFLGGLKVAFAVEGGGTILEAQGFEKKADNKAAMEMTGAKMIAAVDELLQDDEKAKAMIRKGVSPSDSESMGAAFEKMRVVMKPGDAAFDYKAEVAKAKAAETPELKELLEEAKKPAKKKAFNFGGGDEEEEDASPNSKGPGGKKPSKID